MKLLTQFIKHRHVKKIAGLLLADAVIFGVTDPNKVPSFMLIVGFVMFCVTAYYVLDALLALPRLYGLPIANKQRLTKITTGTVGGLVALQSIGQLNSRDVLVVSLLTVLLYLYSAYAKGLRQSQMPRQT